MGESQPPHWVAGTALAPVGIGILSSAFSHEVAHRVAAAKYRVKLSPPYFLPSLNLGTLGGVTRLRTLAPSKAALFDIAQGVPLFPSCCL